MAKARQPFEKAARAARFDADLRQKYYTNMGQRERHASSDVTYKCISVTRKKYKAYFVVPLSKSNTISDDKE